MTYHPTGMLKVMSDFGQTNTSESLSLGGWHFSLFHKGDVKLYFFHLRIAEADPGIV